MWASCSILRACPVAGVLAWAVLLAICIAMCSAKDLSFSSVPTSSDVDTTDVPKLAECLIECASNPANILAPFTGAAFATQPNDKLLCTAGRPNVQDPALCYDSSCGTQVVTLLMLMAHHHNHKYA